jgi:hypothetical protein
MDMIERLLNSYTYHLLSNLHSNSYSLYDATLVSVVIRVSQAPMVRKDTNHSLCGPTEVDCCMRKKDLAAE